MSEVIAVQAGHSLPGFRVYPTTTHLFCFSAVTWNPHRIHYDAPYTTEVEGYPGVLVHGPLLGAWLMRLAQSWVDAWGVVATITYRSTKPVTVGQELTVGGVVTVDGDEPAAEVWVALPGGTQACRGVVTARRR